MKFLAHPPPPSFTKHIFCDNGARNVLHFSIFYQYTRSKIQQRAYRFYPRGRGPAAAIGRCRWVDRIVWAWELTGGSSRGLSRTVIGGEVTKSRVADLAETCHVVKFPLLPPKTRHGKKTDENVFLLFALNSNADYWRVLSEGLLKHCVVWENAIIIRMPVED